MTKIGRNQVSALRTMIDRDLSERLREHARFERGSMGEVVERALRFYLDPLNDKFVDPNEIACALEARVRHQQHRQRERIVRGKATLSTIIGKDMLERLRGEARQRGVSMGALVERALEVYFLYDDISVEWMLRMAERFDTYRELGIMGFGATGCASGDA